MYSRGTITKQEPNVWKGVAAGAIGGIVASWVMEEFQSAWMKVAKNLQSQNDLTNMQQSSEQEPATVKAAELVSEKLFSHHLDNNEKGRAGNPREFRGYNEAIWGITASDGPGPAMLKVDGIERRFFDYEARGAPYGPDDGTIAPWAVVASLPFAPEIVLLRCRVLMISIPK